MIYGNVDAFDFYSKCLALCERLSLGLELDHDEDSIKIMIDALKLYESQDIELVHAFLEGFEQAGIIKRMKEFKHEL